MKAIPVTPELRRRLLTYFDPTGDGCWQWRGPTQHRGYGSIWFGGVNGSRFLAHRAVYTVFAGPIPDGLVLDHLCRNTGCVNPAHLEPVTNRENLMRGMSPMAIARRDGRCKRGHDRTPSTVSKNGLCKRCNADRERERRLAAEAADPSLREARLERLRRYSVERRAAARSRQPVAHRMA